MNNMIKVINENLKSVIKGIKTHREDTEKTLADIETTIQEKIAIAGKYKESVDKSKTIISTYEEEITELENDLKELNEKFGSKDFKEIIAAGNKEINSKIIEKRALITEQAQKITDLTKKVQDLKNELIKLNERKENITISLKNSKILENYFCSRLNSIIDFSIEHMDELEKYQNETVDEKLVTEVEYDDKTLTEQVDSSIFNEIDSINIDEFDEEMIESVLASSEDDDDESGEELIEQPIQKTMTEQLDDIISSANFLIKKSEDIKSKSDMLASSTAEVVKETEKVVEKAKPTPVTEDEVTPVIKEETNEEVTPIITEKKESIEEEFESAFDLMDKLNEAPEDEEEGIIDIFVPEKTEDIENIKEDIEEDNGSINLTVLQNALEEVNNKPLITLEDQIKELGLNESKFTDFDLSKFKARFNKENTKGIINVLKKHDIDIDVLYDAVDVISDVTKENIDVIISNLEKTNASSQAIGEMFKYFDKINVTKLETAIRKNPNRELTEVLIEAVPEETNDSLRPMFDLDSSDLKTLSKSCENNEFKIINTFTDIVYKNYRVLKNLDINNLKECFTKYPHRFVMNPDRFKDILDKYDTDDLIRCINKNAAVLNRL